MMRYLFVLLTILVLFKPVHAQSIDIDSIVDSSMKDAQEQIRQATKSFGSVNDAVNANGFTLTNTELRNQSFAGKNLTDAVFINSELYNINFRGADLTGASFTNIELHNVDFSNAILKNTIFLNTEFLGGDLRGARFDGAQITNVGFTDGVKLYGVDLTTATLLNVDYDGADFNTARVVKSETITKKLTQKPINTRYHKQANIDLAILFEFDSDTLQRQAWSQLEQLSGALLSPTLSGSSFLIVGHTDAKGSDKYNMDLSYRRAYAVRKALVDQLGVDARRLRVQGYGESRPVASNDSDYGRSLNRRVTIVNLGK